MARTERQQQFHSAVIQAWEHHAFKSYRQAEAETGVNYTALYNMHGLGRVPSRAKVIEWAEGIGEPINKWLELAGYDTLREESLDTPRLTGPQLLSQLRAACDLSDEEYDWISKRLDRLNRGDSGSGESPT